MRFAGLAVAAFACLTSQATAQARIDTAALRPAILDRARLDPGSDVAFHALVMPETVYVGQQATYQVGVFLSEEVRARLRRNPQFQPPEVRSTLAFDLPSPPGTLTRAAGSRQYDVHVFQRALFPLTTGAHVIPAARLDYALPLSNSFFAREENHSARTASLAVVARDPPLSGRPAEYRGAVGQLAISSRVDTRAARVGDPLTITVSVDGIANVTLLPRPTLRLGWADVVESGERVELDSTAVLVRGRKDFDWIVTPRQAGTMRFPPVRYPYFNPYTERYELALTPPESLTVAPGASVAAERDAADSAPAVAIRRIYTGEVPVPLSSHGVFWLLMALAPIPAVAFASVRRPERRRAPDPAHVLRALAGSAAVEPATLRRAYAAAMAARVRATPAAMSDHQSLRRTLRRAGVSAETARTAEHLLSELDAVVFGRLGAMRRDAPQRAWEIVRAIDSEACAPQTLAARSHMTTSAVLLLALATYTAWAAAIDPVAETTFRQGVAAYDARRFVEARDAFASLASARPRSADAWMNLGSASWQLTDTAAAAIGWQRSLRLQPMARDVRDLLVLTPGFRDGPLGDVPPVSLTVLAIAGGVFWLGGWGAMAVGIRRRTRHWLRRGGASILAGLLVAIGGLLHAEVLSGRRVAVVVSPTRMRAMPALGAEPGAETLVGEQVRVVGRQGVWTLVRLADGRRGWLESQRLEVIGVE